MSRCGLEPICYPWVMKVKQREIFTPVAYISLLCQLPQERGAETWRLFVFTVGPLWWKVTERTMVARRTKSQASSLNIQVSSHCGSQKSHDEAPAVSLGYVI